MLICVLGSPSAFSAYGALLVRTLVRAAKGDVQYLPVCTPEQLAEAFADRKGRPVVLFSDNLDRRITEILLRVGAPILLFLDDVVDAVGYTMAARKVDVRVAIQMYTQSISCLAPVLDAAALHLVRRPAGAVSLETLLMQVCQVFGIDPAAADDVIRELVPHGSDLSHETLDEQIARHVPNGKPHGAYRETFSADDLTLMEMSTTGYEALLHNGSTDDLRFRWPVRLFRDSWRESESISGSIGLEGPARYLMFGPLLHLPPGSWVAAATIHIEDNWSKNVLVSDVVADNEIASTVAARLPVAGAYTYELKFTVTDPRHPVALRLAIKSGAIEGRLELLGAECVSAETPAEDPRIQPT